MMMRRMEPRIVIAICNTFSYQNELHSSRESEMNAEKLVKIHAEYIPLERVLNFSQLNILRLIF